MKRCINILLCLLFCIGCKEPFILDEEQGGSNFLVVEGYINTGEGATTIKLSRTVPLGIAQVPGVETGALVAVEDENSKRYLLDEKNDGVYSAELNLPATGSYRIAIHTKDGKEFVSELQSSITTPPIDKLNWSYSQEGVGILLSTHDASNSTRYYQFDYEESWEVISFYRSALKYQDKKIMRRDDEEAKKMYQCWKSSTPTDLILHSTAQQVEDITPEYPLIFIPMGTERLAQRYSVLVKQHALTQELYQYLQLMKKNTGPMGSFSDPQPSELNGNIRCTTTDEQVVGYVGVSTTSQVRIFINVWDLPFWNYSLFCELIQTRNHPDTLVKYLTGNHYIPTAPFEFYPNGEIRQFYRTRDICVDCRRLGGNNVKPEFFD